MLGLFNSVLISAIFVSSLYIWRNSSILDRDVPLQIKRRLFSTLIVCIIAPFITQFTIGERNFLFAGRFSVFDLAIAPILVILLYFGPIVSSSSRDLWNSGHEEVWVNFRNWVAGPIAEEWVFRACMCPMLKFDGYSLRGALLISPGLFGVCHLHHLINLVRARGLSIKQGMIAVCFQLFYTFLFGMFATFVFWKTGSLLGVVLAHSLCNFLGFPDLNLFARRPGAHVVGILLFSIGIYALASDYVQLESSFDSFQ